MTTAGEPQQLKITGTWQDHGLFKEHSFSASQKSRLKEHGQVEVILTFNSDSINETKTKVSMQIDGQTLIKEEGQEILHHFYKVYANQIASIFLLLSKLSLHSV